MASMIIVPDKDMDVINEYLNDSNVFLIRESDLAKMPPEAAEKLREENGNGVNWLNDDADVWVTFMKNAEDIDFYEQLYDKTWG